MRQLLRDLDALSPDDRGRVFEHLVVPWILRESPVYRDVLAAVWAWNDFRERHRWGSDLGIDLIAEEGTGRLWAVQAKAHAADHRVTWSDISTFVGAAAARPEIGCLVLVTTAQSVGRRARHQLQGSGKPSIVLDRERLEDLGLPDDVSLADLARPLVAAPRLSPRPHQAEAIAATVLGFQTSGRGQVIHACGTGKTLTALWTKEALGSRRTIVFCPSLSLVDQTLREWQAHKTSPFTSVVVCSDQTIGGPDSADDGASPLELAVPPTTDAERLREILNAQASAVVVFATYQSSAVVAEALRGGELRFDLLVADEAHRTTGASVGDFHRPLDDSQIGADRRLFLTATPRIFRAKRTRDADNDAVDVVSMDDPIQYGPRFHCLSFREGIERDLLSDYRVVIFGVTPGEVAGMIADRAFVTHDGTDVSEAKELATHVGLARAMKEFGMRRTISFHSRVKNAKVFADRFRSVVNWLPSGQRPDAPIWTTMLSGEDSIYTRRQVLRRLQEGAGGECGLVANARCLSEGVDVPTIDGIVFVDPKSSNIAIVQAVGRALRKSKDKSGIGTIVLPLVIPDDAVEAITSLEASSFAHVWSVIDALRSHDEVLGETLDTQRRGDAIPNGPEGAQLPRKIILRVPSRVSDIFTRAVTLKILERTASAWEGHYARLVAYHAQHGDCRVPSSYVTADGFVLGNWVAKQRSSGDTLSAGRRARLDALDFIWDTMADRWEVGYTHLRAFHAQFGHANVVKRYLAENGYALGLWCLRQRSDAVRDLLSVDHRARLDALGFNFVTSRTALTSTALTSTAPNLDQWEEGYWHLAAFHQQCGHTRVPRFHMTASGFPLRDWVDRQRPAGPGPELSDGQIARLDALGFNWFPGGDDWEEGFVCLQRYRADHGDTRVPKNYCTPARFRLGFWCVVQKSDCKRGALSADRQARLDAIGFDPRSQTSWNDGFAHLRAYRARYGDTRVSSGYLSPVGFRLGDWCVQQRSEHAAGTLAADREAQLAALGFLWGSSEPSGGRH